MIIQLHRHWGSEIQPVAVNMAQVAFVSPVTLPSGEVAAELHFRTMDAKTWQSLYVVETYEQVVGLWQGGETGS
jgi:hypothetical protein